MSAKDDKPLPSRGSELERRLEAVIAGLGDAPDTWRSRDLLLELHARQIELEMQGRELREAQQALEVSRNRYERLFDLAPVGYLVLDRHSRIRDLNLAAAQMLGRHRSALIGTPFSAHLAPGDMQGLLAHLAQVMDGEPSLGPQVFLGALRDGPETRILELHSCRRKGDNGLECFSALLDVTAREEVQQWQRESDRFRQTVLDALPVEVAVLDRRGRIIAVNQAWRRSAEENGGPIELRAGVGVDYLAVCRRTLGEAAEEAGAITRGIESVITGECTRFVREFPCPAGDRQRWYALTAAPVTSDPAAAVLAHVDITERKLAEERARQARDTMAQRARVNAVGTLAVSLIHELTQPLNAAGFYSGSAVALLSQGTQDPDKIVPVLAGVDAQIKRAADILHRLRDFARQRKCQLEEVEIDSVVHRALALVGWFAAERHVRLEYTRPAPGLKVRVDALQVEQVLVNLICNSVEAIEAADTPSRETLVGVQRRPDEIVVSVTDTGPGLSADRQGDLFDIFATSKGSGLGMGLAISRDIVEAHQGSLWAEPSPTGGTEFRFTLPCPEPRNPIDPLSRGPHDG